MNGVEQYYMWKLISFLVIGSFLLLWVLYLRKSKYSMTLLTVGLIIVVICVNVAKYESGYVPYYLQPVLR